VPFTDADKYIAKSEAALGYDEKPSVATTLKVKKPG
jgi:hypothetical protein